MYSANYSPTRVAATAVFVGAFMAALPAFADTVGPVDFESPTYSLGTINGQDGWMKTGPFDSAVSDSLSTAGFGAQSLRISNAVTSGSFGDQTFSPSTTDEAGETTASNGGYSGGTRQSHFEASFDIASTMLDEQPGLFMSVSPDRGDGSRMSYLSFADESGGIRVTFYDVSDAGPLGTQASFDPTDLGLISRDVPHTIKFVMDFVDGPGNDVVKIYIDGTLVHTGTTWEDYYRYDPEQAGNGNLVPTVDSLLFRVSGAAAPATAGNGYLIDNLSLMSGQYPRSAEITSPDAGADVYGVVHLGAFLNDDEVDPIQWAVRQGTCAAGVGTVFGNVDGHTDTALIDISDLSHQGFSFSADMSALPLGTYCFVYNPVEDSGEANIRLTREFNLVAPPLPVAESKQQCMKGGWMSSVDDEGGHFKNQGDCVSFVATHGKNKGAL